MRHTIEKQTQEQIQLVAVVEIQLNLMNIDR
jgi:hypothetical protein